MCVLLGSPLYYSIQQPEDQIWSETTMENWQRPLSFISSLKKLFYLKVMATVVMQKTNQQWFNCDILCFTKIKQKHISSKVIKNCLQARWLCTIVEGFQLYDGSCSSNIVISVNNLTYIYVQLIIFMWK